MDIALTTSQVVITLVALLLGGFSKGVTGLGLPMIITPPLVWVFGIQVAVPLVAIPTMISNIFFIYKYRRAWREILRIWPMVLAGLLAIVAGIFFLRYGDQNVMALILAVLAIIYAATNYFGWEVKVSSERLPLAGPLLGIVAGFFHGTTGVSGPPVVAYLSNIEDFTRDAYFQAMGFIFFIFGLQQIGGYALSGIYTVPILQMGLLAAIPVMGSFYLGTILQAKLDAQKFKKATLLLIFLSGFNLLINNLPFNLF